MRIYTKTGDEGKTSLYYGKRVEKSHPAVKACGAVDELNSVLGLLQAFFPKDQIDLCHAITDIQKDLIFLGSSLSGKNIDLSRLRKRVTEMEKIIDRMDSKLPKINNFLIPGGGKAASFAHFARSIARRTEREMVLLSKKAQINNLILMYLNRLPDLLFVLSRHLNMIENVKEQIWKEK